MFGSHQGSGDFLYDICDGTVMEENSTLQSSSNDPVLQIIGYFDEMTLTSPLLSRVKKYKIGQHSLILSMIVHIKGIKGYARKNVYIPLPPPPI